MTSSRKPKKKKPTELNKLELKLKKQIKYLHTIIKSMALDNERNNKNIQDLIKNSESEIINQLYDIKHEYIKQTDNNFIQ